MIIFNSQQKKSKLERKTEKENNSPSKAPSWYELKNGVSQIWQVNTIKPTTFFFLESGNRKDQNKPNWPHNQKQKPKSHKVNNLK
jgi:hypothetical protein